MPPQSAPIATGPAPVATHAADASVNTAVQQEPVTAADAPRPHHQRVHRPRFHRPQHQRHDANAGGAATGTAADNGQRGAGKDKILAERFKTQMCRNYEKKGSCPYENKCMFAHGEADLRTPEMNVRDGLFTEESIEAFRRAQRLLKKRAAQAARQAAAAAAEAEKVACEAPTPANTPVEASLMSAGASSSTGASAEEIASNPNPSPSDAKKGPAPSAGSSGPSTPSSSGVFRHNPYTTTPSSNGASVSGRPLV